jgi:hypothetical protein
VKEFIYCSIWPEQNFATGVACMHVPRLSRKQTNPSKARLMSNASHLGEAIEHHHNQDSMKKPTKKRPTSGKIKRRYPVGLSTPTGFLFQDQNAIAVPICVRNKNSSAHSSPMIMPIPSMCSHDKEKEEKIPSLFFMCTGPAMQIFPHFMRSFNAPRPSLGRHNPDSKVG